MLPRSAALLLLLLLTAGHAGRPAAADVSANIGFASDYYYRGIFQASSSVSAGLDYETNGFYAGTWAADVKDGLEIDGYFGYGGELNEFGYSIGYTGYFYTGDFDDTYQEINLGGSYGLVALDIALGQYDNLDGPTQDYSYYALTIEKDGFFGKFAGFGQDFDGNYAELGYATTIAEIDVGATLLFNDDKLSGDGSSDQALIITLGKTFDID